MNYQNRGKSLAVVARGSFDNSYVNNWHINSDYLSDEVPVFRSLKIANEAAHGESVRHLVKANRYARQNRLTAALLGVTNDDIH